MRPPAILLLLGLAFVTIGSGCRPSASVATPEQVDAGPSGAESQQRGTVTIEIAKDSDVETIQIEDVAAGTTVESLMRSIDQIPITIRGSGVTAFVDGIGQTVTSSSDGWTYRIDGEFANEGIGSMTVTPPTTIRWTYGDASEFSP